ncbi:MAG: hypothetical protein WC516_09900 [Patescibacteria group bacterium]|jgi:hypothetical protein
MKFLIDLIFGKLARSLDGYKTTIGGAGLILVGLAGLIGHYWPDAGLPDMDTETSFGYIAGGFTALGIGGKIEKVQSRQTD